VVATVAYRKEELAGNTTVLDTTLREGLQEPMPRLRSVRDMLDIRFWTSSMEVDRSAGVSRAQRVLCGCDELCRNR
jgi:hypothetical protein